MQRITHATRLIGGNGTGKDGFTEGERSTQRPATVVTASFLNLVQEELCNVVTLAGLTLNANDPTQLSQAIAIAATGSSSANAISIRGVSVLATAPTLADLLIHNGSAYAPAKIANASVSPSAAIAVSKLAAAPADGYVLGNVSGVPTWQNGATVIRGIGVSTTAPVADDVMRFASGSYAPGKLNNANIASNAAIDVSKLSAGVLSSFTDQVLSPGPGGVPAWTYRTVNADVPGVVVGSLSVPGLGSAHYLLVVQGSGSPLTIWGLDVSVMGNNRYGTKVLFNGGVAPITLNHADTNVAAANRFVSPTSAPYVLNGGRYVILVYRNEFVGWQIFLPN